VKRSYVTAVNGVLVACDSIHGLTKATVKSEIVGGQKAAILAATPMGSIVLAECYLHEADKAMADWVAVIFGGPERKVAR